MSPRPADQPGDSEFQALELAVAALEAGNWRAAIALLRADGSSHDRLTAAANLLALSMFCQAIGDVDAALRHLDAAARILPSTLTREDRANQLILVNPPRLADQDPAEHSPAHQTWSVCRIAWREQTELIAIRDRFRLSSRTARDELIDACIEYLIWVEFDPWTWRHPNQDQWLRQLGIVVPASFGIPRRKDMCARASALRKLAIATLGDVSESVWKDIGGYRGLREQALRRMARRPPAAWNRGLAPSTQDVPAQRGRSAAWSYAQTWASDV
jgi:hypothetical protein